MPKKHIEALGTSKKPPVHVKVNDYEYTSTVAVMSGMYLIPFAKEHREKSHIQGGDAIDVELTVIEGQRLVEIPEVLLKILLEQKLLDTFNEQSYSTRKELVRKVLDVKKEETLQKRIHEVVNHLKKQIKSDDLI